MDERHWQKRKWKLTDVIPGYRRCDGLFIRRSLGLHWRDQMEVWFIESVRGEFPSAQQAMLWASENVLFICKCTNEEILLAEIEQALEEEKKDAGT